MPSSKWVLDVSNKICLDKEIPVRTFPWNHSKLTDVRFYITENVTVVSVQNHCISCLISLLGTTDIIRERYSAFSLA